MKETGIIMSGDLPRLILDGRETMTRRVIKLPEHPTGHKWHAPFLMENGKWNFTAGFGLAMRQIHIKCPYGGVGDRLWVKETFCDFCYKRDGVEDVCYKEDLILCEQICDVIGAHWKSGIFMPRWASRILLEITALRVDKNDWVIAFKLL